MGKSYLSRLLLVLVLVTSQWAATVHSIQHELLGQGSDTCQECAIAHAAPVPPAALALVLPALPDRSPDALPRPGIADRRPFARPNNRAPPSLLA